MAKLTKKPTLVIKKDYPRPTLTQEPAELHLPKRGRKVGRWGSPGIPRKVGRYTPTKRGKI